MAEICESHSSAKAVDFFKFFFLVMEKWAILFLSNVFILKSEELQALWDNTCELSVPQVIWDGLMI